MNARKPLISLEGVEKRFGDVSVLAGISAEIGEGEFFSLLGPSGCGKTTLLRCIAGFEEPTAGTIRIDGRDMTNVPANHRPTNMVFQSYAIFPHLNVERNVGYGLARIGVRGAAATARIREALEMVDLAGFEKRASTKLSGGQRQRVALARALVMRPRVLLLDEPLSALDKKLREQMQVELRQLQRHVGITFILVTHDQEEALIMSDRVAVMFDGQIAQLDTPQALYRRPKSRRVASFIGVMNLFDARIRGESADSIALDIAGLGRVDIPREQAPSGVTGGTGSVGIRPEMLSILFHENERAEREVEGEITETQYYGDMTYYSVRLPGAKAPATVSMRNTAGRRILREGEMARVGWGSDSVVLLG